MVEKMRMTKMETMATISATGTRAGGNAGTPHPAYGYGWKRNSVSYSPTLPRSTTSF